MPVSLMMISKMRLPGKRLLAGVLVSVATTGSPAFAQMENYAEAAGDGSGDGLWHAYTHYAPEYDECDAQLVGKLSHSDDEADDAGMELIIAKMQDGTGAEIPALLRQSRDAGNQCSFASPEDLYDPAAAGGNQSESVDQAEGMGQVRKMAKSY